MARRIVSAKQRSALDVHSRGEGQVSGIRIRPAALALQLYEP